MTISSPTMKYRMADALAAGRAVHYMSEIEGGVIDIHAYSSHNIHFNTNIHTRF